MVVGLGVDKHMCGQRTIGLVSLKNLIFFLSDPNAKKYETFDPLSKFYTKMTYFGKVFFFFF